MAALLYRLGISMYALAVRIAALFNAKAKLFIAGRRQLLTRIEAAIGAEQRPRIWMHCASLGEFEQGRPVLEAVRGLYPDYAIVLTFFSPSGYEVRKNYQGADYIFYLPIDTPANARKFVAAVQPKLTVFVKYEFWYYYLRTLHQAQLPVIIVSAIFRESQSFFKWYGGLHRRMLSYLSHLFVQDDASARLLERVGIRDVTVNGDTRFDRVLAASSNTVSLPIAEAFCADHKIIIAGSSWPQDEALLQQALAQLDNCWKLIIVPHEVHEAHIQSIEKLFGADAVRWSQWKVADANRQVLIVDTIGLLLSLYRHGTVAWIGGGFGSGIHNVLEAAVYGLPCFFGPVHEKFKEARDLIAASGAYSFSDADALVSKLNEWAGNTASYDAAAEAARNYVAANAGATQQILDYLAAKKLLTTL